MYEAAKKRGPKGGPRAYSGPPASEDYYLLLEMENAQLRREGQRMRAIIERLGGSLEGVYDPVDEGQDAHGGCVDMSDGDDDGGATPKACAALNSLCAVTARAKAVGLVACGALAPSRPALAAPAAAPLPVGRGPAASDAASTLASPVGAASSTSLRPPVRHAGASLPPPPPTAAAAAPGSSCPIAAAAAAFFGTARRPAASAVKASGTATAAAATTAVGGLDVLASLATR